MEETSPEKLWGTKKKRVIQELVEGRDIATQLQNRLAHLHNCCESDQGSVVSAEELVMKVYTSFSQSLSVLNSCDDEIKGNIGHVGSSAASARLNSQDSGHTVRKTPAKDRRGCYKRRKTSDSWRIVSSKLEDGYAWRKYGQKGILNSKYPRCYFRCTYKHDQGCQALKQVQQLEDGTQMFNITYFGQHTCKRTRDILKVPQMVSDSDSVLDSCSLNSFEQNPAPFFTEVSKEEKTNYDQLVTDHVFDSAISWEGKSVALKPSYNASMFFPAEMESGDSEDHVDSGIGYLCGSTSSYRNAQMEMSLIRSVNFDDDFQFDDIMFPGAPT